MSLYTRARKHIDMKRVKEMREEKIKREKIAEVKKQQEEILAELKRIEIKENLKYSNWRRDLENLNETMTTAGMGMINYPAMGNVNLGTAISNFTLSGSGGDSGYNARTTNVSGDRAQFDTMVVTISTTASDWVIEPGDVIIGLARGGAGSHTVVIPRTYSSLYFSSKNDGSFTASVSYQRRAPVNVFVSLDDPLALSFIRGGLAGSEERRQQLKDQLEAGNAWMYMNGLDPSQTSPGDIALDTIPYEPPSPGPGGYKPPGSYDPSKFFDVPTNHGPQFPSPNLPDTGPGRSRVPDRSPVKTA